MIADAARTAERRRTQLRRRMTSALRPWLEAVIERVEPMLTRAAVVAPEPTVLACVYRREHAARVAALLRAAPTVQPRLWALDEIAPALARHTVGHGPGGRFELLNRCLAAVGDDAWIVVTDDDCAFESGTLERLLGFAALGGFDLCQPSHARSSHASWAVTRHQPLHVARTTRFVEIGPLIVLSPRARRRLLPFPEDLGMGYGAEALWASQRDLRLGIIDAVTVRHVVPVSSTRYDVAAHVAQSDALLAASGHASWDSLQRAEARWTVLRTTPPWPVHE